MAAAARGADDKHRAWKADAPEVRGRWLEGVAARCADRVGAVFELARRAPSRTFLSLFQLRRITLTKR